MRVAHALASLAIALIGLVGCAASASDDGDGAGLGAAGTGVPMDWRFGGQTGSLMPGCGLAPVASSQGVPASGSFVVYTSACSTAPTSELALIDAQGNAVPVQTQAIGSGVVLVTPEVGLEPGSYTLTNLPPPVDDDGGGPDDDGDAGLGAPAGPDAGAASTVEGETVIVLPPSASPTRLGELQQSEACVAGFDLVLDPGIVPHLPSLALDLRVNGGPPQRIVTFGTLQVSAAGRAHIAVPLEQLSRGTVTVTVEAVLAGEPAAIEPATLTVTCQGAPTAQPAWTDGDDAADEDGCSVSRVRSGRAPPVSPASSLLLSAVALYRWRRRRRPRV